MVSYCFRPCDRDSPDFKHRKTTSTSTGYCCLSSLISIPDIKSSILVSFNSVYIYIKIYIYIYIIQILCVCVCLSVTYRRQNGWTDHYQILRAYADRSGNGSYLKKIDPTTTQGAFWGFGGVKKSQIWERFQTAAPIWTKFGTCMQIHRGMDVG